MSRLGRLSWNLSDVIGDDLSLPVVVSVICKDRAAWTAFSRFCAEVMRSKEDAERAPERREPDSS